MDQQTYLARYKQICDFELDVTRRKGADYAGADNVFRNFTLIEHMTNGRISTQDGFAVRMGDKYQRIVNLLKRANEVPDESILDTLIDLACYSKLLYIYLTRHLVELPISANTQVAEKAQGPQSLATNTSPGPIDFPTADPVLASIIEKYNSGTPLDSADKQYILLLQKMNAGAVNQQGA